MTSAGWGILPKPAIQWGASCACSCADSGEAAVGPEAPGRQLHKFGNGSNRDGEPTGSSVQRKPRFKSVGYASCGAGRAVKCISAFGA
jgi:hypothetical protein